MSTDLSLDFCDHYDAHLAAEGPPSLFIVNGNGELRLADDKTRDAWQRLPQDDAGRAIPPARETCHCLFRDRATGWVQYVLCTSPALYAEHPRADVTRYDSQAAALAALAALGTPPVADRPL